MIKPKTISEQLLFTTLRIENGSSIGTGFFFTFKIDEKKELPVIITNKHVIKDADGIKFNLHESKTVNKKSFPSGRFLTVNYKSKWVLHPDNGMDLCATPVQPLIGQVEKTGKSIYYTKLHEDIIWSDKKLEGLSAVEDILMIGYPIGLWDNVNNLPLIRKGITATHPAIDFQGKSVGVVDIACFPGSSGSPILIANEGIYSTKKATSLGNRAVLLGILFSGPFYNSEGEIVIEKIPTVNRARSVNKQMVNIGLYVKSKEIVELGELIKKGAK